MIKKKPTQPRNKEAGKSNFRLKVRPEIEQNLILTY